MAIERFSLSTIREQIRLMLGETNATYSKISDAQITALINAYGQTLVALLKPKHLPMYRATGTLSATISTSTVYLPADCPTDEHISFYDTTNNRNIDTVEDVALYHPDLVEEAAGTTPRVIELLDWTSNGSVWQRKARLWPTIAVGTTPTIDIDYWRLPAAFPNSSPTTEYADIDPTYQMLFVYGPLRDILVPDDPAYDRIKNLHDELFSRLAQTAR